MPIRDRRKWEVYGTYLADQCFTDPHPDVDELVTLLKDLSVPLELIEAYIDADCQVPKPDEPEAT